jgi:hypothetical protein
MKLLIAMALLTIASTAYGQTKPSGAVSVPGCGAANIEFNVKTDDKQHAAVQPDAGKANVYFLQDDAEFGSNPRPTTRFGLDGAWTGATHSSSYFYVSVDPGRDLSAPSISEGKRRSTSPQKPDTIITFEPRMYTSRRRKRRPSFSSNHSIATRPSF